MQPFESGGALHHAGLIKSYDVQRYTSDHTFCVLERMSAAVLAVRWL
jgi:hypothetical protein